MSRSILIVEDDHDIRDAISEFLAESGFEVQAAENGLKGLEILRAGFRPGIILLDLMMPVMDGFAFREEQNKDPQLSHIPVVVMSADGNISQKQGRLGAAEYLKKPLDIYDLVETLNKQLDK
jgi:CheY-like chemotaxis protein